MHDVYQDPLVSRYTDLELQKIFSDDYRFRLWRECWIALAEAQHSLGLKQVTKEMIDEMKSVRDIDYELVAEKEKEIRHDVMAHVHEFGTKCPKAKGIIHLGATSQFVVCNTDLVQMRESLDIIQSQVVNTINNLAKLAEKYKDVVTLGYTHMQPAQPTTVGKRLTLYLHDLMLDLEQIEKARQVIHARGAKGTTGTQASFMELFNDEKKVRKLDKIVAEKLGFDESYPVTGQTYTRKVDSIVLKALAGVAESATKFAVDLRLASALKIMEEPFAKNQTGSSAMAYKRNPMRSERMTALARRLINMQLDASHTFANQWMERSLDDSSIRRMYVPQMFLLSNAILKLYQNITEGLVVYPAMCQKHLKNELPFMATEIIIMELSKKGLDRQVVHEKIKKHSIAAGNRVKLEGKDNDLFERIAKDMELPVQSEFLDKLLHEPKRFAGLAESQTERFLKKHVKPVLKDYREMIGKTKADVSV